MQADVLNTRSRATRMAIISKLGDVLEARDRSLYWLQHETGLAYTTLFRLRHGKARSVSFEVLNSICKALSCQPGDVFIYSESQPKKAKRRS